MWAQRAKRLDATGYDVLEHSDCTSDIAETLGLKKEWNFLQEIGIQYPKTFDVINCNPKFRREMLNEAGNNSDNEGIEAAELGVGWLPMKDYG